MRVAFFRPNLSDVRSKDAMTPLVFGLLRSITPPEDETLFYDERLEEIPLDLDVDLVAMTVETYTARRAYQIAGAYRARGVPVVLGGFHPTLCADEALQYADAVALGDAEGSWPAILRDARAGRLEGRYGQAPEPFVEASPDRSIYAGKRYTPLTLVQYARGCRYNCEFCSIRAFYGTQLRQRPVRDVVRDIEATGSRNLFIVDDNIFVDKKRAREVFEAIEPLGVRWSCQVSIDVAHDPPLLDLMRRSGCTAAIVGFESLDLKNLRQMKKQWNVKQGDYPTAIQALQDAGVMIYGTFVFGYDQDTPEDFERAVEFAIEHKFFLANFNPLTPTPGTPLFARLQREGRLLHDKWWLERDYTYGEATFTPRGMTPDQLTEGCYRARTLFNTFGSMARRLDRRTSLRSPYRAGLYALGNLISRKEIHAKQGRRLGADAPLPSPRSLESLVSK